MQLVVIEGGPPGEVIPIREGTSGVGRHPSSAICLPSAHVSAEHCVFLAGPEGLSIRDLNSTNGVWVDDQRVLEARLPHGARVRIGDWLFAVDLGAPLPPPVAGTGFGRSPPRAEPQPGTDKPSLDPHPAPPAPDPPRLPRTASDEITTVSRPLHPSADPGSRRSWIAYARRLEERMGRWPWNLRLAGVFVLAGLLLVLAPGGGLLAQVAHVSDVAEAGSVERARALALALAAQNAPAFQDRNQLRLDVSIVKDLPGVRQAYLTDTRGAVRAPVETLGRSIAGTASFDEAIERGTVTAVKAGRGRWTVLAPIRARPVEGAPARIEGWACLDYDARAAIAGSDPRDRRVPAAVLVIVLALGGAFVLTRRLIARPLATLGEDLELALVGHATTVGVPRAWAQAEDLARSVNRLLRRWHDALAEGEGIETAVARLPIPFFVADASGRVRGASPAGCRWLGLPREDLVGRDLARLLPDGALTVAWTAAVEQAARRHPAPWAEVVRLGSGTATVRVLGGDPTGPLLLVLVE
ncbi:MAG: FHA domain-containing protein [Deltaproteobacteria bacterium]|nr:FHA domain-containing protein [Deltaproteobacteria bacterium]